MKVQLGLSQHSIVQLPEGAISLSEDAAHEYVHRDVLKLDFDSARELGELFAEVDVRGREFLFQALLVSVKRPTTYWRVRHAAIEFLRRKVYQPAIEVLREVALEGPKEWLYQVLPVLAEMRDDRGVIMVADAQTDLELAGSLLEDLIWVPTRRALARLRQGREREESIREPFLRELERLEAWGDQLLDAAPDRLEQLRQRAEEKQPFPEGLREALGLEGPARVAWDARFLYWNALATEPRPPHVLDFTQGIIDARDALLKARKALDIEREFDGILEIDGVLREVVYRVDVVRDFANRVPL